MQTLKRGLLLLLVMVAIGCESAVEFPGAPFRSELVVTSEFSAESPWIVVVQRTVGFDEVVTFPVSVENATVTIDGDDGSRVELEHKGGGFYHSNCCKAHAGVTYQLQVEAEGFETVTAIDRLPEPTVIQDVRITSVNAEWGPAKRLEVDFKDDGNTANFYELSVSWDLRWSEREFTILNAELQDQLNDYALGSIFEPELDKIYARRMLLHDKAFDNREIALILETYPSNAIAELGGGLSVKIRTVSEAYYRYRRTQVLQDNATSDPFAEAVEVRSNVRGGLGMFAGYAPETHGELSDAFMRDRIAGFYELVSYMLLDADGNGRDRIGEGGEGKGELRLRSDNTVLGSISLPIGEGEFWSAPLDGGFLLKGNWLRLFHSDKTLIQDLDVRFEPERNRLAGSIWDESTQLGIHFSFKRKEDG